MREVGTLEARNSLSALLELVAKGEEITITKHGKPIARLVPAKERDVEKAREAAAVLRAIRAQARTGPESLKDLVNAGRRY
ncbi:MAG: type II toxin-antitoxin system Phd/YefM family antitoxin [Rhizobiaceae bacterium]